jgi:hypothetical protein
MSSQNTLQELNRVGVISKLHGAHRLQPSRSLAFRQIFFRFHSYRIRCAIRRWLQCAFRTCPLTNDFQAASQLPAGWSPRPSAPSEPENFSKPASGRLDQAGEPAPAPSLPGTAPTRQKTGVRSTRPSLPRGTLRSHAQRGRRKQKLVWPGQTT